MTNIRFIYLYRDASNYKQHGEVILSNKSLLIIEEVDQKIRSFLSDDLFFIARQLQVEERFFDIVSEDDHPWHEYVSVEVTTDPAFDPAPEEKRDIAQFLKELEQAHHTGWDEMRVPHDLIQQIEKERLGLTARCVSGAVVAFDDLEEGDVFRLLDFHLTINTKE